MVVYLDIVFDSYVGAAGCIMIFPFYTFCYSSIMHVFDINSVYAE